MNKPKVSPFLSSSLIATIGPLLGIGIWAVSDTKGVVTLPKEIVVPLTISAVSVFAGLVYLCWQLSSAFDLKERRSAKVQYWREHLEEGWSREDFVDSLLYSDMRLHLKQSTRDTVEGRMRTVIRDRKGDVEKTLLMDNISAIEKHWGLI